MRFQGLLVIWVRQGGAITCLITRRAGKSFWAVYV